MNPDLQKMLETHPCYNEEAHRTSARMHLPVAPACNIQCNFCNRRFDCTNESRPGVTSEVLTPEQAADKVAYVKERIPNLSVIGIAGPGDPMANESTFRTLELIGDRFPELTLCISTNGLALPENAQRLFDLGVRFVTVTVNAGDPETGAKVYSMVNKDGKRLSGTEGAALLLENQKKGIKACADLGMLVKVNIVMIPGINTDSIPALVKEVRSLGAYIVNILPLIPVPGTPFGELRGPTPAERKELMDQCSLDARMMRHCRQCRADAIGLLGEDRSQEFAGCGYGSGDGCGPVNDIIVPTGVTGRHRVAVASTTGSQVDCGFGNAPYFFVYGTDGNDVKFVRKVETSGSDVQTVGGSHRSRIEAVADLISDCDTVIVSEIGDMPRSVAESRGIRVAVMSGSVRTALAEASRRL